MQVWQQSSSQSRLTKGLKRQSCSGLPMGNDDHDLAGHIHKRQQNSQRMKDDISSHFYSRWLIPLLYGIAFFLLAASFRTKRQRLAVSAALDLRHSRLEHQLNRTREILSGIFDTRSEASQQYNRLKSSQDRLEHELRMVDQLAEIRMSSENMGLMMGKLAERKKGTAMAWIHQRQEALYEKLRTLQEFIREQSRERVLKKYGRGPYRVEFQVKIDGKGYDDSTKNNKFVVELAPLELVPHAVETFLDMVESKIWDNTVFYHHSSRHHVIAAAPVNHGTFELKHHHFAALGYNGVSFPEYTEEFPHEEYTIGFSGTGPNFYINTIDNSEHHGPGGQIHHDLPKDADPCFGRIVWGKNVIRDMMPDVSSVESPVSWHDYDLTRIVQIRLIQ